MYPSWTSRAPGGIIKNIGRIKLKPAASVSVFHRNEKLYALEDASYPFLLEPESLQTIGEDRLGIENGFYNAHPKIDGKTGEWIHFGIEPSPTFFLHLTELDATDAVVNHRRIKLDQNLFIHDYFVTAHHIIMNMHPCEVHALPFLLGLRSFAKCFKWAAEKGNLLLVFNRGQRFHEEPVRLETDSCWMWHSINAFERNNEIIADFVGYEYPDHFIGNDPATWAVMEGREIEFLYPGKVRRYVIDPGRNTVKGEILFEGNYEFPFINRDHWCHEYRYCYLVKSQGKLIGYPYNTLARLYVETGETSEFAFSASEKVEEPVFVKKPDTPANEQAGWLLSIVHNEEIGISTLAILDAEDIPNGPVARIQLDHHTPLSFHGFWKQS